MAENYFEGEFWSVEQLLETRKQIQQQRLLGAIVRVKTGPSQETEFDTAKIDLAELLRQIGYALFVLEPDTYPNPYRQIGRKVYTRYA